MSSGYLFGYKPDDNDLRTWRVDRIEAAGLEKMPFTVRDDIDVDSRLSGAFGIYDGADQINIKIRFSGHAARFVSEKHWHDSQQLTPQKDGSLIVELDLSSTIEVKSWILGFGREAQVLEPAELQKEILEDLTAMMTHYASEIDSVQRRRHAPNS